ncbi:MAG: hypothetical protein MUP52_10635 [Candidatus Aminicenantes bacterium]|nr:hypothetical protein [Candidatus Aminicenantes bacterium]
MKRKTPSPRPEKTVFIAVNMGFSARYLLRTDILHRLLEKRTRVVILTPNAEEPYFREEFEKQGAYVEKYEFEKCRDYYTSSRIQRFFRTVRWHTLPGISKESILYARFKVFKKESRKTGWKGRIQYYFVAFVRALLLRSVFLRKAFLEMECHLFTGHLHRKLFERYQPSLLVTTSLGYFDYDQYLMREAKRHGVKVAAIILSWDNSSSKGLPAAKTDRVIAWSDFMKAELMKYYEVPPKQIFVGGIAHFDPYFHPEALLSREALFAKYGMDPRRKLIFFGTRSPNKYPWTGECIRLMAEALEGDRSLVPCQLLVRLHPNHYQIRNGRLRYQNVLEEYEEIKKRYRWVFFNKPQIISDKLSCDMPTSEMIEVGSILRHADIMINYYSTLMLEASIFDLPIINFVFHEYNILLGRDSRYSLHFDHIRRILERKAEITVYTMEDLIRAINEYLTSPEKDREGRKRVRQEECGPNQGRAGVAIADYLLELMD